MPNANDTFITILKKAHLEWGSHRHTTSRGVVYGEGYLQIPSTEATRLKIYNSNNKAAIIEYNCNSRDGFLVDVKLKASGCSNGGDVYAKQFQGSGNLKVLGDWFKAVDAQVGDQIQINWTSPVDIVIAKI